MFTWVFMTVFRTLVDVLRLQSCTFMLTAVFTWVFMTVFRTLVDVLRELIRSVFAELHLGVHGWLC